MPERSIKEPEKKIPVSHEADVAVAGGGVSGVFAAIASARRGARTVLIDRFGEPGGNMGPGKIIGGSFCGRGGLEDVTWRGGQVTYPTVLGGFAGIPKEFIERHAALGGGSVPPYRNSHYLRDSGVASYVAFQMLAEAGAELILSAYAADPVIEDGRVVGLFYEGKSGREAVSAKVVIDATGEADLARRAGLPVLMPKKEYHDIDGHAPIGMGIWATAGGVDNDAVADYVREHGNVPFKTKKVEGLAEISMSVSWTTLDDRDRLNQDGLFGIRINLIRPHEKVDPGSSAHISRMERETRMYAFEVLQGLKKTVPGFENAFLLSISPFLGVRGGQCITGEYILTHHDCKAGRRFDDVTYMYGEVRALRHIKEKTGQYTWTDMPYRVMVARGIDGLMAVGRSASGIPDTLLRGRMAVMHMGEVGGTAAALATESGKSPRDIDTKELQRRLLEAGYYLGDRERLKELGLVP